MSHDVYESPLAGRYASPYMLHLFSPDMRFQTWRRLWTALARAQHQLGLPITDEQVAQLEAAARRQFAAYKSCTANYCRRRASGASLEGLTVATRLPQ